MPCWVTLWPLQRWKLVTDAQKTAVLLGIAFVAHTRNDDALRPAELAKGAKAMSRRPVLWPEIRLRNPHALNQVCEHILRWQCYYEFVQFGLPELRA